MQNDDIPIPRKKKGTKLATQKRKIKSVKSAAEKKGRTYGIYSFNIADTSHADNDSVRREENANGHDSELLLVYRKIGQMANKINKDKIIVHECNILTDLLNPIKCAKKSIITHQYYRAV